MVVDFEGKEYNLDFDDITVQQAIVIKTHCKMTLKGLEEGLADADPDALRALFWLMQVNSGVASNIDTLDFKIVKFSKAVQVGAEKQAVKAKEEAAAEADAAKAAAKAAGTRVPKAKAVATR
jgi:hypothetical protein